jgi:hypothetical protein
VGIRRSGARVILNGHEYVAWAGQAAGIGFAKEGNCFMAVGEPDRLAQVADTLPQPGTTGRLSQVIDRWIYTACLCFGLDLDEQQRSGFGYSVYQVEYSRNLVFASGAVMDRAFGTVVDRQRIPARRAEAAHAVRQQGPSAPQTRRRTVTSTGSRDRETSVEPEHLQGPLRAVDVEGLHQRRTPASRR